jgi:thioredoxin:protein disulfide reductase
MREDLRVDLMKLLNLLLRCLVVLLACTPIAAHAADEFLDPLIAFRVSAQAIDATRVEVRFDIAPGHYLYRDKFSVSTKSAGVELGALQLPKGLIKYDPNFQKDVETFRDSVTLVVPYTATSTAAFDVVVGNQGCADKGLCYPPMERSLKIDARTPMASQAPAPSSAVEPPASFDAALGSGNLLRVAGVFTLAGLLLSLTPCVLPMLPILSSIIVGERGPVSRSRGFSLALAYSLGMAMVYTALGMAAGLAGEGLAGALQNAWTLGAFALLLVVLSLSMFGVYELRMPAAIQGKLVSWSGGLKGGRHAGVFAMGGLSALIVSPCVAAPLAGALLYIRQTRDVTQGGVALFALACGMSVPLLLLGLSAGTLLPRAGAWMQRVKHGFGVLLIGVAAWIVWPVLPSPSLAAPALLQPDAGLEFETVTTSDELHAALQASLRPAMVDFYADWCVACKELEAFTFTDPRVAEALAGMTLLRVDLTEHNDDHKALLRRYQLFGPPAVLFFAPGGAEVQRARVIGFVNADTFVQQLRSAHLAGAALTSSISISVAP